MTSSSLNQRNGGHLLVEQLISHGTDKVFCVPGESYLAVLDALYTHQEQVHTYVARQDGGAAFMAAAYGKFTGKPGICFVTRGPGATNASIAVHTAFQDSDPMILFVGQVASDQVEREAFQEIDYRQMFGPMCKWVAQIDRVDRIGEYVARAYATATSGRPGPVVLALPEDMLTELGETQQLLPYTVSQASPSQAQMHGLQTALAQAERPMVILAGAGWTSTGTAHLRQFIEAYDLPVSCAFRFQDAYDNALPNYVGDAGIGINPALGKAIKEADLIIAIGARLGEMTTSGYTLLTPPRSAQKLIHIHNDVHELNRVYQADLAIASGMNEFALMATQLTANNQFSQHTQALRDSYLHWQTTAYQGMPGDLELAAVVRAFANNPEDTVYTNGAGNFSGWLHRFHQYRRPNTERTQLAPSSGSMGYGVPAAVAAKITDPKRRVICFTGDGDFMMTVQELATAVHYRAGVIFMISNNGYFGTIRLHQEREYTGRVSGTDFTNPDFAAMAKSFGAHGECVRHTEDFASAYERAIRASEQGIPAVIDLIINPDAITTQTTISKMRAAKK